jgi:hypothetical protein
VTRFEVGWRRLRREIYDRIRPRSHCRQIEVANPLSRTSHRQTHDVSTHFDQPRGCFVDSTNPKPRRQADGISHWVLKTARFLRDDAVVDTQRQWRGWSVI